MKRFYKYNSNVNTLKLSISKRKESIIDICLVLIFQNEEKTCNFTEKHQNKDTKSLRVHVFAKIILTRIR